MRLTLGVAPGMLQPLQALSAAGLAVNGTPLWLRAPQLMGLPAVGEHVVTHSINVMIGTSYTTHFLWLFYHVINWLTG